MANLQDEVLLGRLWAELGGRDSALTSVSLHGRRPILPSVFDVDALATASVALATLAAADLFSLRTGKPTRPVTVDRLHAASAFRSERYLSPLGWELPPVWDPIAGDYQTNAGWIRLHTNYAYHRDAALRVLGVPAARSAVAAAVRNWDAEALEAAVVAEGGCAAKMRSAEEFSRHPQGVAIAAEPVFAATARVGRGAEVRCDVSRPLEGVRVLDLTRVIAGPVCTRFLAAHGADVLRIDPPDFEEVGALLAETTAGKRRAALDLRTDADRAVFERLVAGAHVLVVGYRSTALERLGFGAEWRAKTNPSLVTVLLDAYGWTGPWAARRGFDSLVQMTTGIASAGRDAMGGERPFPLPAQALDHAAGYLAAAAACRGLASRVDAGQGGDVRLSLLRTAGLLTELGTDGDPGAADLRADEVTPYLEEVVSPWGALRRVRCPGIIEGSATAWSIAPGPLGVDAAIW